MARPPPRPRPGRHPERQRPRSSAFGGYRPGARRAPTPSSSRRSTPATSGSGSAPASSSRRWAAPDETVIDMAEAAARRGARAGRAQPARRRRGPGRHRHPPVPDARPRPPLLAAPARHRRRPPRSTSRPRAPASATASPGQRHGPRRHAPSTCSSSASRSSPTSPTCTTAAPPSSSATARARSWSARPTTPGIGPTVWGSDGSQWDAIRQRDLWIDVRDAKGADWPHAHDGRARPSSAGPSGRWRRSPSRRWTPPASAADDLDAFIPHQANMRIIDAMVKQLKLPEHVPVARDIATPATRRPRRSRSRWSACSRRARPPRGGLALLIGFGAGLVLRRPGRRPALSTTGAQSHGITRRPPVPSPPDNRHEGAHPHGHERAGDPRGSRRDRQRGDRFAADAVQPDKSLHRRPRHRLPVDDDDRRQRRGEVRRAHPRRRRQEPEDRRRRRLVHRQSAQG